MNLQDTECRSAAGARLMIVIIVAVLLGVAHHVAVTVAPMLARVGSILK